MPLTEIINKENIISGVENINISGKVCIIRKLFDNLGYVMSIELQAKLLLQVSRSLLKIDRIISSVRLKTVHEPTF